MSLAGSMVGAENGMNQSYNLNMISNNNKYFLYLPDFIFLGKNQLKYKRSLN